MPGHRVLLILADEAALLRSADIASRLLARGIRVRAAVGVPVSPGCNVSILAQITGQKVERLDLFDRGTERVLAGSDAIAIVGVEGREELFRSQTTLQRFHGNSPTPIIALYGMCDSVESGVPEAARVSARGAGMPSGTEVSPGRRWTASLAVREIETALIHRDPATRPLSGKRVIITGGPTRESLDPIRFISNRSTGQMSIALADEALHLGAEVTLIHGPLQTPVPFGVRSVPAESAAEMFEAVQQHFPTADIAIFAAAVANYASPSLSGQKIKGGETLKLELVRTRDIAAWAGHHRASPEQLVAGFCAESENLMQAAANKLRNKCLDLIFANPIGQEGVGFAVPENSVTMLTAEGEQVASGRQPKEAIAGWIWSQMIERCLQRSLLGAEGL